MTAGEEGVTSDCAGTHTGLCYRGRKSMRQRGNKTREGVQAAAVVVDIEGGRHALLAGQSLSWQFAGAHRETPGEERVGTSRNGGAFS